MGNASAAEKIEMEAQILDTQRLRDEHGLRAVTDTMARDAVDVRRRQAGVRKRRHDGPQRQRERADARVLGELGVADARDRRTVA